MRGRLIVSLLVRCFDKHLLLAPDIAAETIYGPAFWTFLESAAAIISACLPYLRIFERRKHGNFRSPSRTPLQPISPHVGSKFKAGRKFDSV